MTYYNLIGSDYKQKRPLSVSVTFGPPQRVRTKRAYLCLFVLLSIYLALRHYVFLPSINYPHPNLSPSYSWGDESTLDVLMETYDQARLSALSLTQADLRDMESVLGMPNASLISDRNEYLDRVQDLAKKWFSTSSSYANMTDAINKSRRGDPRLGELRPVISSTCKGGKDYAPVPFLQWEDIVAKENEAIKSKRDSQLRGPRDIKFDWEDAGNGKSPGKEWDVDVMDDEDMEATFFRYAGEETEANSHLWRVWDNLNFIVLKTDLLRYMMLQHDGGLYTDSDTIPRSHPERWGEKSFQGLPDSIAALQRVIGKYHAFNTHHRNPASRHSVSSPQAALSPWREYQEEELSSTILEPDVSAVVSIEGLDWTPGATGQWFARPGVMPRRIQIVQWTMMSKAFHPIFIDVVGTVLNELERQLDANTLDGSTGACSLTGPGPFTDAVFRYLLATQGVTPYDLAQTYDASGTNLPGRFGDVVVYNQNSFSANYKGPQDTRTNDISRPVAHMYWGRWKNQGWD